MINTSNGLFPLNPGVHCRNTHIDPKSVTVTVIGGSGIPALSVEHN